MFVLRVLDLLALVALFVQTFAAWIFVVVLASLARQQATPAALRCFLSGFVALAAALTIMSVRFFHAHGLAESHVGWGDGDPIPLICYMAYMALKVQFGFCVLFGSYQLAAVPPPRSIRRLRGLLLLAMSATPLLFPDINDLLIIQTPTIVACALGSLWVLRPARSEDWGMRLVRGSLVALAASWSLHACAVIADGRWGSRYFLSLNSVVDLAVQMILGIGLIVCVLQTAHRQQAIAEREREDLRRQLDKDEKLRALGTVVSGVAHELNNPLTVISGYAQLLQQTGLASNSEDPSASIIAEQAERCRGIVRNLSALAGQSVQPHSEIECRDLIERVMRGLAPDLLEPGRRIDVDCPAGLRITVDRIGIEQVVENLLINALHATPAQGTVSIGAHRCDAGVEIVVADQGPGVTAETRERLFDPFFTTKDPGKGTGLGLSIAHAIVRHHGGTIWLDDVVDAGADDGANDGTEAGQDCPHDSGAVFRVRIPDQDLAKDPPPSRPEQQVSTGSLLVVDDDEAVRAMLREMARRRGWNVQEAPTAEQALSMPLSEVDAILCDLRMPGMGGVGFHDRLRVQRPEVLERVVFVTGDLASEEAVDFSDRCTRPLLQKPFDYDDLFGQLGKTLAS